MGGCKGPITTFIVEPFIPHNEEFYLNIMSERLGCNISFSECGGIEIEENWDKVKTIYVPTGVSFTSEMCALLVATLPLEVQGEIEEFIKSVFVSVACFFCWLLLVFAVWVPLLGILLFVGCVWVVPAVCFCCLGSFAGVFALFGCI